MRPPRIKKLYQYVLQNFLPLFCMTFFICLFVVLMQFLWRYIDNLVGKGLGVDVIGELFFYAALTMVPMALPLAVLLASLMTFGNMGERLELTAMKSAGVSLLRTMLPLMWFMAALAVGAFFFQNNVLPVAQTKMWTLLYSMRQKSPELEIPEGIFYDQIPGYNIFVHEKDRQTGILRDMMIYDFSSGFDNAMVILADSGRLAFTEDKTHLYLHLWQGESFENLKDAGARSLRNVPYRREQFSEKELVVPFDANFNRLDEEGMRNQYVGKDMARLLATIDSIGRRVDSIGADIATDIRRRPVMDVPVRRHVRRPDGTMELLPADEPDAALAAEREARARAVDVDSVFSRGTASYNMHYLQTALTRARDKRQEMTYRAVVVREEMRSIRRHAIEMQRKFTLSFACIIFFFIGAPLGAIIRKGGLGVPIVISVILFIFYYIIDNIGYKMAREGRIAVWEGMWLSSAVLLPLGIVLTWKAVNDSAVFNADAYTALYRRLRRRLHLTRPGRPGEGRSLQPKEVIIHPAGASECLAALSALEGDGTAWLAANGEGQRLSAFCAGAPARLRSQAALSARIEEAVALLHNYPGREVALRLNDFPLLAAGSAPLWLAARLAPLAAKRWGRPLAAALALPLWLLRRRALPRLRAEVVQTVSNCRIITATINNDNTIPQ